VACGEGEEEGNLIGEQVMFMSGSGTFSSERSVNSRAVVSSELTLTTALVKAYCLLRWNDFYDYPYDFHSASMSSGVLLPPPTRTR
jgi:hypothetical protein